MSTTVVPAIASISNREGEGVAKEVHGCCVGSEAPRGPSWKRESLLSKNAPPSRTPTLQGVGANDYRMPAKLGRSESSRERTCRGARAADTRMYREAVANFHAVLPTMPRGPPNAMMATRSAAQRAYMRRHRGAFEQQRRNDAGRTMILTMAKREPAANHAVVNTAIRDIAG